jgi:hypothetical protein
MLASTLTTTDPISHQSRSSLPSTSLPRSQAAADLRGRVRCALACLIGKADKVIRTG